MALEINAGGGPMVEATEKLWLTAEKDELVPDGDERAAYLFCTPGTLVSKADAERLGMGKVQEPPAEDEPESDSEDEPEQKQTAPAANKRGRRPADK